MRIKKCGECGFSWVLAKVIRFNDNGTITQLFNPNFRVVLIEGDFLTEVFQRIETELGLPILHIVFEAQRNASIHTINDNLWGPLASARWTTFSKRFTVNMFCRLAVWTGQSYAKTVVYKPGWLGEAIVRNPFNRELMAAIIVGAFEALERMPYSHQWYRLGDDDVISIRPEPSRPEIAQRLTFDTPPPKPGKRSYPRCPRCGVPQLLKLEWHPDEGIIMDTRRNVRMVFLDAYTPVVVFRELAKELGEDIYPIIIEAQRDFSLHHLRQEFLAGGKVGEEVDRDTFYIAVLDTLALRGQGNPVDYDTTDGTLRVVIENPFQEHLLAGLLSAMYELGEGRRAEVSWNYLDPSTLEFTVGSS